MATFELPTTFQNFPSCTTDGRVTPPSSPEMTDQRVLHEPFDSALQPSKAFTSAPSPTDPVYAQFGTQRDSAHMQLHHRAQSKADKEGNICRPLPPSTDIDSASNSPRNISPRLELRRASSTYCNLRAAAQSQHDLVKSQTVCLLPSPVFDDKRAKTKISLQEGGRGQNFELHPSQASEYKSYEDLHILSMYQNHSGHCSTNTDGLVGNSGRRPGAFDNALDQSDDNSSASSSPRPRTPTGSSFRSRLDSCESDWLANTMSHEERLRRFNARCFQVVQHPIDSKANIKKKDREIALATVLVGPGKPRLVQIQRPPSSICSATSKDTLSRIEQNLATSPRTPVRQYHEISVFSPYDTPFEDSPLTNISAGVSCDTESLENQRLARLAVRSNPRPEHLSTTSSSSTSKSDGVVVFHAPDWQPRHPKSLSSSLSLLQSKRAPGRRLTISRSHTTPALSSTSTHSLLSSQQELSTDVNSSFGISHQLKQIIDPVIKAIEAFPKTMLRLDSPILMELRRTCNRTQNADHLLNTLSSVFPGAMKMRLDSLAAWLLIDQYFDSILAVPSSTKAAKNVDDSFRAFGGLPGDLDQDEFVLSSDSQENEIQERQTHLKPNANAFSLVEDITAVSNASLYSIPSKARNILGIKSIYLDERQDENLLRQRARVIRARAKSIGLKIVKSLTAPSLPSASSISLGGGSQGCGRDTNLVDGAGRHSSRDGHEELWRALKLVVEMTDKISPTSLVNRCEEGRRTERAECTMADGDAGAPDWF